MLFAATQHGEAPFDPAAVCMDEKTLMGSYSSSVTINDEVAQLVLNGYKDGFDLTQLISHRFSSVRMADRIVVLADGRVEDIGTHEELLARGGRYKELFELQAAGYR